MLVKIIFKRNFSLHLNFVTILQSLFSVYVKFPNIIKKFILRLSTLNISKNFKCTKIKRYQMFLKNLNTLMFLKNLIY